MYISILLPPGTALTPGAVGLLLRYAQRRTGAARWGAAAAEVLRAPHGTLLLLRPALSAHLADYALPYLRGRRGGQEMTGSEP